MVWSSALGSIALWSSQVAAQSFQATPVMGWNSYNQMSCNPNEEKINTTIHALADRGFVAAGYQYFQIDCGWTSRDTRRNTTSGALKIDLKAFPNGLKPLSDLARSKGMKWSMYSDAGYRMCDPEIPSPVLGSLGHEAADAALFKSLNTEYVKYDNCYADGTAAPQFAPKDPRTDFPSRMGIMADELRKVGIYGFLICQWGTPFSTPEGLQGPHEWTKGISTSFRLSDDISPRWHDVWRIYNQIVHIAKSGLIGEGHIPDADMLEVGNAGMTVDEQSTHFAAWAMFKSALMISTDITALSSQLVSVLQNEDLIAINQDPAVQPVVLVQRWTNDHDLWAGDLFNGDIAVLVVDLSNTRRTLDVQFSDLNITSATVKNLWTGNITTGSSFSAQVNPHGSLALRLSDIKRATTPPPTYTYLSASTGSLSNGATTQSCPGCTSSHKVSYLGGPSNGSLVLSNIPASTATQTVLFDYINSEISYLGNGSNERLASVSVNGGAAQTVSFPLSGYNWDRDVYRGWAVQLNGFRPGRANTIAISGVEGGPAPDLDQVGFLVRGGENMEL